MSAAPLPRNEQARLELLHALKLLDTPAERAFDSVTRLAARTLGMPIAAVSLIDRDRQWFKSTVGLEVRETPREQAFCAHAIVGDDEVMVVADARQDARFVDNVLVTGEAGIRFYAGVPITSSQGLPIGTLCVIDREPRELSEQDRETLLDLAAMVRREVMQREAGILALSHLDASQRAIEDTAVEFLSVFELAAAGMAIVSPQGDWLRVNSAVSRIVGYSAGELRRLRFQDITHPDDLELDLAHVRALLEGRIERYEMEKRYIHKNGGPVWVNLSVALRRHADGSPHHFIAVIENIQARKQAEASLAALRQDLEQRVASRTQALHEANVQLSLATERMRAITDNVPALVAYVDADGFIRFINQAYRQVYNDDPQLLIGTALADLAGAQRDELAVHIDRALAGERVDFEMAWPAGRPSERQWSGAFIPEIVDGRVVGFNSMVQDISERHRAAVQRDREARQDALTGLPNRRALFEMLPQALARAEREGTALALLFLDLDGFKQVNDTLGHEAGDALLIETARRLLVLLPPDGYAARLAGDEFTVVLEATSPEAAGALVACIEQSLGEPFALSRPISIGVSIGLALHRPDEDPVAADELMRRADDSMYEIKHRRRRRLAERVRDPS